MPKPFDILLSIDKVISVLLTETMMSIDNKTPNGLSLKYSKRKSLDISGIFRLKLRPYRFNLIAMSGLKLQKSMRKYALTR